MTSVSRSDSNDEAPEGTGTGVPEQLGDGESTSGAPGRAKGSAKRAPARTKAAASAAAPADAAAKSAARSAAAKRAAATRAARKAEAAKAAKAEQEQRGDESTTDAEPTSASKRSSASRSASSRSTAERASSASSARAAKSAEKDAAKASSAARSRSTSSVSAKRQALRAAAAVATDTTAAERPKKAAEATTDVDAGAAAAQTPAAAPEVVATAEAIVERDPVADASAVDEETQERLPAAEQASVDDGVDEETRERLVPQPPAEEPAAERAPDVAVAVIPAPAKKASRKKRTLRVARQAPPESADRVLVVDALVKRFGDKTAVDHISLEVRAGSFFGVVGPNGAGKTTTLSMVTGLLRPDGGTVRIHDIDAWADPEAAKRATGVLPDRLRLFDRLTGGQLLHYSGTLRGLDARTVRERSADLIAAFGLEDAVDRLVADYSAGMTKKIALACAMIHSPRLLVLDEPFESVDPVSAANLTEILERYVAGGGTVVLSSHGMDLIERVCDSVAVVVGGKVLAAGTLDEVRQGETLEDRFVALAGGRKAAEGMEWLHSFSD
ncbi:ABC transporter ATP-binding protein [Agromyces sp. NPDC060279]|uniref:ABC transporter ATP-binding protein n=1 Tax=Agromyces sp. NPDC060279 TaxID=3347092 RepID=UPI003663895C